MDQQSTKMSDKNNKKRKLKEKSSSKKTSKKDKGSSSKRSKKSPKIPPQVLKSLKERHPDIKDKKELKEILTEMVDVVLDAYQDHNGEQDRLFYWSKPEREAVLYIAANKLVDKDVMERIFADIKSCDDAVAQMSEPQREALALFPKLLGKVFDDVSKEDFDAIVDAIPEKHSAKACRELSNMIDVAIDIAKKASSIDSEPLKDLGNFKSNAVSDILKSLISDFALTHEKALSRLELVKKSLVVG